MNILQRCNTMKRNGCFRKLHCNLPLFPFPNQPSARMQSNSIPKKDSTVVTSVFVDKEILEHLQMKNHERKVRLCLSGTQKYTLNRLRSTIENKLKSLKGQQYKLRYKVIGDSTFIDPPKTLTNNREVAEIIQKSYDSQSTLQLFVQINPTVFPSTSTAEANSIVSDPAESNTYTMISFYKFARIAEPQTFIEHLHLLWKPFKAYGRVYVASEGVNAQMAVPTNVLSQFKTALESVEMFREMRLNTDHRVTREEFERTIPFKALHIRLRDQVVTDGLQEPLDWSKAGQEVDPLVWHERIADKQSVVLDCRNHYESDIGLFENAIPLNTSLFSESWAALEEVLKDKPKDTPILTYCTGGIRCVKINAYLQQKMGFNNTGRLKGGIISYTRQLELASAEAAPTKTQFGSTVDSCDFQPQSEAKSSARSPNSADIRAAAELLTSSKDDRHIEQSRFKGVNYVFDERLGARVTDDVLASCETCGESCDNYCNCSNPPCNVRFIQCGSCRTFYDICCSQACQSENAAYLERIAVERSKHDFVKRTSRNAAMLSAAANKKVTQLQKHELNSGVRRLRTVETSSESVDSNNIRGGNSSNIGGGGADTRHHASSADSISEALNCYAERHSATEPALLQKLRRETEALYEGVASRMMSGHLQGRLLTQFTALSKANTVLELGAFTGYSTLCFAEGLQGRDGAKVYSCESDPQSAEVANKFIRLSEHASKVDLRRMKADDLIDAMRAAGTTFDIVFIDADKRRYEHYLRRLLGEEVGSTDSAGHSNLLNDGALVIVDNTLWKGLVLSQMEGLSHLSPPASLFGEEDRMAKVAGWMHSFNQFAAAHPHLSPVLLPMRDGLTLIRYSKAPLQKAT